MFEVIFLIGFSTFILWRFLIWKSYADKVKNIPSPKSLPILGHCHVFFGTENIINKINEFRSQYKKIMKIWLGPLLSIMIINPVYLEALMGNYKKTKKGPSYVFFAPLLGESILTTHGPNFDRNKNIIMQTFSTKNLMLQMSIFNENAGGIIDSLATKLDQGIFNVDSFIVKYTMHNLLDTTLGVSKDILSEEEIINFSDAVQDVGEYVCLRSAKVWLYPDIIYRFSGLKQKTDTAIDIITNVVTKCIQERKKEYEANMEKSDGAYAKSKKTHFLDGFFSFVKPNRDKFTEEEIKNEVVTIMIAGHETTAVTIGFALSVLGFYKDVQDKVRQELDDIFQGSKREVTYEDAQQMQYLDQVLQEIWRLYPPVTLISRTPLEDIHIDNYTLPEGSQIIIPLKYLHLNGHVFPNPEQFNPEHFSPEAVKDRHSYSYLPFSTGYRKCIGAKFATLSVKVFLANMLREFNVQSDKVELINDYRLVSMAQGGFRISIKKIVP